MKLYKLYIKIHNVTGLKYLGYTTAVDVNKYPGSGLYWKNHLKKHGYNHSTKLLIETTEKSVIREQGLYYSKLWNIVDSTEWANIKPELGPGSPGMTEEIKEKIRNARKKQIMKPMSEETKQKISKANSGKIRSTECKVKMSKSATGRVSPKKGKLSKFKGIPRSDEIKSKISESKKGKTQSEETRRKISETLKQFNRCKREE